MARNYITNFRGEMYFTPSGKLHIKDEPITPLEEDFGDHNHLDYSFENNCGMRKSLSMNDIAALRDDLVKMEMCHDDKQTVYQRYQRRPTGAPHELSKTKFVSMAESIYHYQRDTPGRFHSTKPQIFKSQAYGSRPELTIPQSPMLRSKTRCRTTHVMSQKEREEMELEELKKFKIKAHPIPKSVIEGTKNLPEVPKKPITIPEPFNLTEIHKKPVDYPEGHIFKARPAPKHILEKPHIPFKPPVQVTKPVSPKFHYKRGNSADQLKCETKFSPVANAVRKPRNGPLRPEPFSFEKRDEEMKKRREERIKQQIEEEKKLASQFKAHPLPGVVKKMMYKTVSRSGSSTASSENKENHTKFEARPPVVLYKEPFKPVLQPLHCIKLEPFQLTTEKRAVERERFDRLLKEKEEEQEKLRKLMEKEKELAEEKAKQDMRAKLVHHAKPVPIVHTFVPAKSNAPITVPETPKFVRRLRQN